MPAPSRAERKPGGMRPGTVLQSCHRHEVWTGQLRFSLIWKWLELAIVISCPRSGQFSAELPSSECGGCSNLVGGSCWTLLTLWIASPR